MQTATARALPATSAASALSWLSQNLPVAFCDETRSTLAEAHERIEAALQPRANALHPVDGTVRGGGKRVRMLLTTLSGQGASAPRPVTATLAAVAEMVHAATLVHDDVIDHGLERRARPAAHVLFGNKRAVLGGDALLTEALRALTSRGLGAECHDLLTTLSGMVEGEYLQLERQYRLPPDTDAAAQINRMKTALLFGWCTASPLIHVGADAARCRKARSFGLLIGEAFQLVDDLLDVLGDPDATGKEPFTDLREGKITLPMSWLLSERPALVADLEAFWRDQLRGDHDGGFLRRLRLEARDAGLDGQIREQVRALLARGVEALDAFEDAAAREALGGLATTLAERVM